MVPRTAPWPTHRRGTIMDDRSIRALPRQHDARYRTLRAPRQPQLARPSADRDTRQGRQRLRLHPNPAAYRQVGDPQTAARAGPRPPCQGFFRIGPSERPVDVPRCALPAQPISLRSDVVDLTTIRPGYFQSCPLLARRMKASSVTTLTSAAWVRCSERAPDV